MDQTDRKNLEAAAARIRPTIADEHYLSGDEVCRMLHVSKRTLQTLRDEKAIPYTSITSVGGKLLYPESGLYEVLKRTIKISGVTWNKQPAWIRKTPFNICWRVFFHTYSNWPSDTRNQSCRTSYPYLPQPSDWSVQHRLVWKESICVLILFAKFLTACLSI